MNKKDFKDFVKSVAVIKDLKPTTTGVRLDENSGGEVRYNDEWVEVGRHANPTLGFQFVKLKDNIKACELGCGDIVTNQVVERRMCEHPKKHWRTQCKTCGCYVSPDGQGFIEGGHAVQAAYVQYFKEDKPTVERPKKKPLTEAKPGITVYEKERESKWTTDEAGNIRLKSELDK